MEFKNKRNQSDLWTVNIIVDGKEYIPTKTHLSDAGYDLKAKTSKEGIKIEPGQFKTINTGVKIELNPGLEAQIRPRSGLAANHGITVLNSPGTIDARYRGEIKVILINHGSTPYTVYNKDRIAQMVLNTVLNSELVEAEKFETETERNVKGLGSSGVQQDANTNHEPETKSEKEPNEKALTKKKKPLP